ncbi:MAG: DNA polymerase IV [Dehalococcoidia bacterium]|nr:DNA polymerase IV [Dehalococcoidia bacterium]
MIRRILHVDLDAFFASVEQALDPGLRGKPVIVGGHPNSRGVVAAASYEARAFGLRSGMPLSRAYRLCPDGIYLPGRHERYREFSIRFMDILKGFSPQIEPMGLDEAFIDLTGFDLFYGPAAVAAKRIKEEVKNGLGINASIGIASNKLVAKVASDAGKPDGLLEIAPGEEAGFLAPLPVRDLPMVGSKTESVLKGLGINTIGQLAAQSLEALKTIFGVHGELLYYWSRAEDNTPVAHIDQPPKSISRSTTLAVDTLDRSILAALLHYLSERVGAQLRDHGMRTQRVSLKLRFADFTTITRSHTIKATTDLDQELFRAGWMLLESALDERRHPVRLVGIGVSELSGGERQLGLLPSVQEKHERLNAAVDKIRKRYGFKAIQVGRTLALKKLYPAAYEGNRLKTSSL